MESLPRHPLPTLDRSGRQDLLAWLWWAAAARPQATRPAGLAPAQWRDLATLAEGHGLAAFVVAAAREWADTTDAAVVDGLARLEDAAARTLARGRLLAREQAALDEALRRRRLPFAWLKGGALIGTDLYAEPAARPRADLDLYLPEAFWPGATDALRALGYRAAQRSWKHAVWQNADHRVVDLRGEHPDNPRCVELHPWLGEGFRGLRLDLGWALYPLRPAHPLPPGLALAHLAAHATVAMLERRLRLVQLLDLATLAERLDDDALAQAAGIGARPGAARFLWPSLALTARLAPSPGLLRLLPDLASRASDRLRQWLAAEDLDRLSWPGRESAARSLLEIPRVWPETSAERLTVWRSILLPPPDLLADRYPDLAAEGRHGAMFIRHLGFTMALARRRWRRRRA
jgi:hypothetical protein